MTSPQILVVQCSPSDPVARLGDWLAAAGAQLRVVDAPDAPADVAHTDADAVIVLGGPMSANDDDQVAWIGPLKTLLRDCVRAELPTLGVCLGAQLLAAATGGRVIRNPEGPEIGAQLVAKRSAAATDPLFRNVPITPDVLQWHLDVVADLPPGAIQLASSPMCANQAFRVGRLAWGIQFHIEATTEIIADWARAHEPELTGWDLDVVVERAVQRHDDIAEVWAPFAAAFVEVARDPAAVPPARGPRVATAEPVTDAAAIRAALAAEAGAARGILPMPGLRRDDA